MERKVRVMIVGLVAVVMVQSGLLVFLDSQYTILQEENIELQIQHDWAVEFSKLNQSQKEYMLDEIRKQTDT